ncbi:hypothetical protein [Synechococcus sp. CS-1332]|uniref:hypothetical protein n=1 Tax=Synechococcus sp. CS-1332 TaxID=2847972 RepID=UPI00223A8429|nr:hypothetical protein [Synechococcus sp. CS-1332]MCT0208260.1 hypothetical protein [Synechococcus sp. CS-1332]
MTDSFQRIVRRVIPTTPVRRASPREGFDTFQLGPLLERLAPRKEVELRVRVRRPDDHLVFDLLFDNLRIVPGAGEAGAELVRLDPARRGLLIVEFPSQSFGEEAYLEKAAVDGTLADDLPRNRDGSKPNGPTVVKNRPPPPLPEPADPLRPLPTAKVRMAGPSRLAYVMPAELRALPFTLEAVLKAMREWPLNLDINARPDEAYGFSQLPKDARALQSALVARVANERRSAVDRALTSSARRVAALGAGGLGLDQDNGGSSALGTAVWEAIRTESVALAAQHPELGDGDLHAATLGTLALRSAAELAQLNQGLLGGRDGAALVTDLPYVSLLLGQPHPLARTTTALELPYRLMLSPIGTARWQHALQPATQRGRTELWHTRLGDPVPEGGRDTPSRIRALWSPDFDSVGQVDPPRPFRMSLDAQDRQFLVKLMGEWNQKRADGAGAYLPRSSEAKRLHLSSLGALLDAGGDWDPRPNGVDLEQWRHLATLGRDHYVRVVYSGFLMWCGHAASLVKVTERKFESLTKDSNNRVAVLRQRFFIIVRERVRHYDGSRHRFKGRNFPFQTVEVLTQVTPNLNKPTKLETAEGKKIYDKSNGVDITERMAFFPMIGGLTGTKFRFEIVATDRDGQRVGFSMPLLFVSEVVNTDRSTLLLDAYNAEDRDSVRRAELNGASVGFDAINPRETQLATRSMSFRVGALAPTDKLLATAPNFSPEMERADVCVPALQKLLGRDDAIAMRYPEVVRDALSNPGELFLSVADSPYPLDFGGAGKSQTDAIGGLAAPTMAVLGLSKRSGPVSAQLQPGGPPEQQIANALTNAIANRFDPKDFFPKEATLIGGITLNELITGVVPLNHPTAPRFITRTLPAEGAPPEAPPSRLEASFSWVSPVPEPVTPQLLVPNADGISGTRLMLSGSTTVPLDGSMAPSRAARAELNNFKLNLFGCIILWFDQLSFDSRPGQKPDVSVRMHEKKPGDQFEPVMFGGPLEFVNDLRRFIPSNGFSDPPALSVTPSGISASYSLGLPSISLGIFSLSNISIGAGFSLPFDNRPVSVRFNFAERQRPFSLTVSLLGGGGFFAIAVGAKGVQEIEAALEFGAAIALSLVVASGMVEIKAGVYFSWKDDGASPKRVVLAGYVRIHGELTIVAIFSASLTFNLQLAYEKQGDQSIVYGEAELIVEVEVLFLSFDVAVRCRREFGGGTADPKFLDLIPDQPSWDLYCGAFASEVA